MKQILSYFFIGFIALTSCETIVDVSVNEVEPYLVVDAWLEHTPEPQVIRLTRTQPYYQNSFSAAITDATVEVRDQNGTTFEFDHTGEGNYVYSPVDSFGLIGSVYFLEVRWNGDTYEGSSSLNRVPPVDSLTFTFEEATQGFPAFYYAEFFATDPVGIGDSYWIKTWKNGKYQNKPDEISLAYDASFSEGGGDGIPLIFPIRFSVNLFEQDINGNNIPPYDFEDTLSVRDGKVNIYGSIGLIHPNEIKIQAKGKSTPGGIASYPLDGNPYSLFINGTDSLVIKKADSIYLELHAVTNDAWFFLNRTISETNRPEGFGALFATPPSNVPTNMICDNPEKPVVGYFNFSAVSRYGRKLTEDAVREQPK